MYYLLGENGNLYFMFQTNIVSFFFTILDKTY